MQYVKRNFTIGETQNVAALGQYIYYKFGQGIIHVTTSQKESMFLNPGDVVKTEQIFSEFLIENISGNTNKLELAVTGGNSEMVTQHRIGTVFVGNVDLPQVTTLTSVKVIERNPKRITAIISANNPFRFNGGAPGGPGAFNPAASGGNFGFANPVFIHTTDEIWCSALPATTIYYSSEILVE